MRTKFETLKYFIVTDLQVSSLTLKAFFERLVGGAGINETSGTGVRPLYD